jgi:hypothetical protein
MTITLKPKKEVVAEKAPAPAKAPVDTTAWFTGK